MVRRWLDDGARLETEAAVPLNRWSHVMLTYDGSRMADGIKIYINGVSQKLKVDLDVLDICTVAESCGCGLFISWYTCSPERVFTTCTQGQQIKFLQRLSCLKAFCAGAGKDETIAG